MNKNLFLFVVISAFLMITGCQSGEKNTDSESQTDSKKDTVLKEPERNSVSLLYDFNSLESIFENQNWMIIDQKDTSFFYASRVNPYLFNTYAYKLRKGDSTNSVQSPIQVDNATHIIMQWQNQQLQLSLAASAKAIWTIPGKDSVKYVFQKIDANLISLQMPSGKKLMMQKTHQISLFLVRSRYDYQNGTKLAFDSIQFNKKH